MSNEGDVGEISIVMVILDAVEIVDVITFADLAIHVRPFHDFRKFLRAIKHCWGLLAPAINISIRALDTSLPARCYGFTEQL